MHNVLLDVEDICIVGDFCCVEPPRQADLVLIRSIALLLCTRSCHDNTVMLTGVDRTSLAMQGSGVCIMATGLS